MAGLLPAANHGGSPREKIQHVFEQVEQQAGAPEFHGCRYLSVQIELKDQSHPASQVAHRIKANLTAFFRSQAEAAGAHDPDLPARQLILVFDGASARAGIQADNLTGLVTPANRLGDRGALRADSGRRQVSPTAEMHDLPQSPIQPATATSIAGRDVFPSPRQGRDE